MAMNEPVGEPPGIVQIRSRFSVTVTAERLEALLKQNGVKVFARIDFGADATRAGLQLRPEVLLIFGNPKAGTPLMVAHPIAGLDLPLKALFWEDADGHCVVAYNDPRYITERHALPAALAANLAAATPLIERACHE
jgi:uncharacterized protein (DUF302 family)